MGNRLFSEGLAGAWVPRGTYEPGAATALPFGPAGDAALAAAFAAAVTDHLTSGDVPAADVVVTGHGTVALPAGSGGESARIECRVRVGEGGPAWLSVRGWFSSYELDPVVAEGIAVGTASRLGGAAAAVGGAVRGVAVAPIDVVDAVREVARDAPQRIAVRGAGGDLSYGELAERALRYARQLDAVAAGDVLLVRYRRSVDTVVVLLGVLASGRAFLLRSDEERDEFLAAAARWVGAEPAPEPTDGPGGSTAAPRAAHPHAAAYYAYTSGTTGEPKAIVIERSQLAAYCGFLAAEGVCGPDADLPALSAPEFDAIIKQLFGQLAAGGAVRFPESGDVLAGIEAAVTASEPVVNTVPTVWAHFLDLHPGRTFPAEGTLLLGGEVLDPGLVARTRAAWPGCRIVNLYGPTECTSNATWAPDIGTTGDRTPIGLPIAGAHTHVLDEDLRPVAPGRVGSLYIGGDGVAGGYHGQPRRTAEAFLPDPDPNHPGARVYATGDRARAGVAGLQCLGRGDAQVKVNGVRIDTESLRADLAAIAGVRAAAVGVHDGALRAFVEADARGVEAARERIRTAWRREVATTAVGGVDRMPTTPGGKTDFRALCTGPLSAPAAPAIGDHAESASERADVTAHPVLEVIWGNVLGTDGIDPTTSLADLGGDSMKRLKLIALYRRILGGDVALEDFAQRDSLAAHQEVLVAKVGLARLDEVSSALEAGSR